MHNICDSYKKGFPFTQICGRTFKLTEQVPIAGKNRDLAVEVFTKPILNLFKLAKASVSYFFHMYMYTHACSVLPKFSNLLFHLMKRFPVA